MMKTIKVIAILALALSAILTGCQNAQTEAPKTGADSAYPSDGSYPVEEPEYDTLDNSAYPVYPIDATQLTKVQDWVLAETRVDNQDQTPAEKTFQFGADASYSLTTDGVTVEGVWTVDTISGVPTLILDRDTDHSQNFEIVNLDSLIMTLQIHQDGTTIEELYRPAN
jgi:hypothetical protein